MFDSTANIYKNAMWHGLEKFLRTFVNFFTTLWMIRYLGPKNFGALSYAFTLILLFEPLVTLGLPGIQKKWLVDQPDQKNEILGAGFALRLSGTIFSLISVLILSFTLHVDELVLRKLIIIFGVGFSFRVFDNIETYFEYKLQSKIITTVKSTTNFTMAGLKILAIVTGQSLQTFAIIAALEFVVIGLGHIFFYKKLGFSMSQWEFKKSTTFKLMSQALPLLFSGIAVAMYMKMDQIMLKHMLSNKAVGIYSLAIKITEIWYIIPMALMGSYLPNILRYKKENPFEYQNKLEDLYRILTFLGFLLIIGVSVIPGSWLSAIFSKSFNESIPILHIYIWTIIFVFWGVAQGPFDLAEDLLTFSLFKTVAGSIINLSLNYLLIPKFAGKGAAIATLVSSSSVAVWLNIFHPRARKIFLIQFKSFNFPKLSRILDEKI
ncbi:MAG: flippase [Bacteriovoracaceae bacterium]|jgi:polysaccharide transporter, PST family|nr:flippase [Bacteriovoracaceae bacterium]